MAKEENKIVKMDEDTYLAFSKYLNEKTGTNPTFDEFLVESDVRNIRLKAKVIQALNLLDSVAQDVDELQFATYIKPTVEHLNKLIAELG